MAAGTTGGTGAAAGTARTGEAAATARTVPPAAAAATLQRFRKNGCMVHVIIYIYVCDASQR